MSYKTSFSDHATNNMIVIQNGMGLHYYHKDS